MTALCVCGKQLPEGIYLDAGCTGAMGVELGAVPSTLDELDTSTIYARSNWTEPGSGPSGGGAICPAGCDHHGDNPTCVQDAALTWSVRAAEAAARLRGVVGRWARVWDRDHPITEGPAGPLCRDAAAFACPHRSCDQIRRNGFRAARTRLLATAAGQAQLLRSQALASEPWAPQLRVELHRAIDAADAAIDLPPEMELAGRCTCGMAVYAQVGSTATVCRWCSLRWQVRQLRAQMLEAKGSATAPAATLARLLRDPITGDPLVTSAQIRGWAYRGALDVAETNRAGQPCYRIADVLGLARDGAPVLATADPPAAATA